MANFVDVFETRSEPEQLRRLADAIDRSNRMGRWVDNYMKRVSDVHVSWEMGSSLAGYDDLRKVIEGKVAVMMPDFLLQAVREAEEGVSMIREEMK